MTFATMDSHMFQSGTIVTDVQPAKFFVGGISRRTTTKQLRNHFAQFGTVLDVVAMRQPDGRPRGFGYVTLDSADAAAKILQDPQTIDGRVVDVKIAVPEAPENKFADDSSPAAPRIAQSQKAEPKQLLDPRHMSWPTDGGAHVNQSFNHFGMAYESSAPYGMLPCQFEDPSWAVPGCMDIMAAHATAAAQAAAQLSSVAYAAAGMAPPPTAILSTSAPQQKAPAAPQAAKGAARRSDLWNVPTPARAGIRSSPMKAPLIKLTLEHKGDNGKNEEDEDLASTQPSSSNSTSLPSIGETLSVAFSTHQASILAASEEAQVAQESSGIKPTSEDETTEEKADAQPTAQKDEPIPVENAASLSAAQVASMSDTIQGLDMEPAKIVSSLASPRRAPSATGSQLPAPPGLFLPLPVESYGVAQDNKPQWAALSTAGTLLATSPGLNFTTIAAPTQVEKQMCTMGTQTESEECCSHCGR